MFSASPSFHSVPIDPSNALLHLLFLSKNEPHPTSVPCLLCSLFFSILSCTTRHDTIRYDTVSTYIYVCTNFPSPFIPSPFESLASKSLDASLFYFQILYKMDSPDNSSLFLSLMCVCMCVRLCLCVFILDIRETVRLPFQGII